MTVTPPPPFVWPHAWRPPEPVIADPLPSDWNRADYPQSNCPTCGQFASRSNGPHSHWIMRCGHTPETETTP